MFPLVSMSLNVVLTILVLLVLYFLYNPQPLANKLLQLYGGENSDLSNVERIDVQGWPYYLRRASRSDRLLVFLPGGAFLRSLIDFTPFESEQLREYTVALIPYPVRFRHSVAEAIAQVQIVIEALCKQYDTITVLGYSAGAFVAWTAIHQITPNVRASIDSFVGICGYYGRDSISDVFLRLVDWCYGAPSCVPNATPSAFYHTDTDLIRDSSIWFARECGATSKEFTGGHMLFYDAKHNASLLTDIRDYIRKLTQGSTPQ